ncbi:hypothetical protein I79_002375 [Cricetulus griseus]|uniref:Uncharacterized protein n=1 Tax=Cricetulus griseus TaxID=10029 RepID=G3GX61_CRIGR|nr:hypothetical protein I79_002375 [Cricetulus griseus]
MAERLWSHVHGGVHFTSLARSLLSEFEIVCDFAREYTFHDGRGWQEREKEGRFKLALPEVGMEDREPGSAGPQTQETAALC